MVSTAMQQRAQAMQARAVSLRDFSGGLNNATEASALSNNELASIINMELDSNGSLVARVPITKHDDFPAATSPGEFLGYYGRADGVNFLVIANGGNTYLYEPISEVFSLIASFAASGCAQYQNRLYICARATRGGWWGETVPTSGIYTYHSLAGGGVPMPFGDQIVLFKDRMWIAGWGNSDERTKVYLSEVTNTVGGDINNWPLLNFLYVSRGDGQWITKLHSGTNDLTIFRNGSSYYFHYDNDPVLGTLNRYEGNVGSENKYTTALYQNYLYTLSNGALYQQIGYQFYRRNDPNKLIFNTRSTATPYSIDAAVSVIGSRLLVWYLGETYSLNLNTLTWSQWDSPTTQGALFRIIPRPLGYFGVDVAYGLTGSGVGAKQGIYRIIDEINSTDMEDMICSLSTKVYDYDVSDRYKTLFKWTADVLMAGTIVGNAIPIILVAAVTTWDEMSLSTWDILSTGTWDHPLVKAPGVETTRTSPAGFPYRVSVQFLKKMRFRRVQYELSLDFDGSLATGPVHVFGLVTYITVNQKITKGVN